MAAELFDVVIIGAGAVGENVAQRVAQGGLSVVIVESELVGGECSYWACMPSKALLRPIEAVAAARRVRGVRVGDGALDIDAVFARRDAFTSYWDDAGQARWLDNEHIQLRRGHGRLNGERSVIVSTSDGDDITLRANHAVVVCTGSSAAFPEIEGLDRIGAWTSKEATSASIAPRRLTIIGGGVVGCEMASAFAALGSKVTMVVRDASLMPRVEPFASQLVATSLVAAGIDIRYGCNVTEAHLGDGEAHLVLDDGSPLVADEVLVAVGRRAGTGDIGAESVGLEPGQPIDSDDSGRVRTVDGGWLWAVGDVTTWPRLTHTGKYHARCCGDAIVAQAGDAPVDEAPWSALRATALHQAVPQVVFTDPQIAAVGLTAAEATEAGFTTIVVDYNLAHVAGAALFDDSYKGAARLIVDSERSVIVGATFVGPEVGELLHAATIAIVGEVPLQRLWHAVPSYPTVSEIWLRLLEKLGL